MQHGRRCHTNQLGNKMTETDTYLFSRMRDELWAQNKKLDKIAEQLEAQTKLQEGIFKQLYVLCQITGISSVEGKQEAAKASTEVFMNTPIPGEKSNEN